MIYTTIENLKNLPAIGSRMQQAGEAAARAKDMEPGKYPIDGDRIFVSVQQYDTRKEADKMENHRRYIDVQCILEGEERMLASAAPTETPAVPYVPERDVEFYPMDSSAAEFLVKAGECLILYPGEPHAPCLSTGEPSAVKKACVKILVE